MKKLLLICASAVLICAVKAQKFGIQAGATFYSYKGTFEDVSTKSDTKVAFTAGVTADFPLGTNFSFMPALNFTQKGGQVKDNFEGSDEKFNTTFNYLELPLNFVYNAPGSGGNFFIGAGPAIAMGLSGKSKSTTNDAESEDINFGSGDDELKALELSANILAGYKFSNGLFVAANYNPGLSDLSNTDPDKFHNNGFAIRIGYMFGGKMKKSTSDTQ
jgi:hypothetical protein